MDTKIFLALKKAMKKNVTQFKPYDVNYTVTVEIVRNISKINKMIIDTLNYESI